MEKTANRIWEIDALRGLCIPVMVLIHLIYDVVNLYGFVDWPYPAWYSLFKNNYGAVFLLISGVSVTLGRRSLRRGLTVFLWGMAVSVVTVGMYLTGMAGRGIIIYFGVLHCLGCCMILWWLLKRLHTWALGILATGLIGLGLWLRGQVFSFPWLMVLGFLYPGFSSSDYFPLILNLGFFLAGAVVGRMVYGCKRTRLPGVNEKMPVLRFLTACGRQSLVIYLAHQPLLSGVCMLLTWGK